MNDVYSPHTGEHIATDSPAPWMGRAGVPAPEYDAKTQGCFWRGGAWELDVIEPEKTSTPTVDQERERARAALNPLRDTFLNRLAGIAVFTQDEAVKAECAELRTALLDITKDPAFLAAETYESMEFALMTRYREIAAKVSPTIKNVFRELTQE